MQEYIESMHSVTSDRYELIRHLADGGFGQVYLARLRGAAGFQRIVAIKRIRRHQTSSPDLVDDFIKEARIGGHLQHHNVVQVLGFEEVEGHYSLIMEYVDGLGLDAILSIVDRHEAELPLGTVAEIGIQAAEGLQYIHTLRSADGRPLMLIHRDIKPSNLMISRTGLVKISDFGVARTSLAVGRATKAGFIKGTVGYMSPEQARGEQLDHRSDLYSLGAILYQLLVLEPLFHAESAFAALGQLSRNEVDEQLSSLENTRAQIFLPLLRSLLTNRPDERIGSAARVAAELRALQRTLEPAPPLCTLAEQWLECLGLARATDDGPPPMSAALGELRGRPVSTAHKDLPFVMEDAPPTRRLEDRKVLHTSSAISDWGAAMPTEVTDTTLQRNIPQVFMPLSRTIHRSGASYVRWTFALAMAAALLVWMTTFHTGVEFSANAATVAQGGPAPRATQALNSGLTPTTWPQTTDGMTAGQSQSREVRSTIIHPQSTSTRTAGDLTVNADPAATVSLNGKVLGPTPVAHANLKAGLHKVEIRWIDGGMTQSFPVTVPSGGSVYITCREAGCEVR